MNWIPLVEFKEEFIRRGCCLKFPGGEGFESLVVMMVCEGFGNPLEKGLITITGQKAGINLYQLLPQSEVVRGNLRTIWLMNNWQKWICPHCSVDEVLISYPLEAVDL